MQIADSVVGTEITGSSVNVAAAQRGVDGDECMTEIVVAQVNSEGELLLRPVRSEVPEVSPMKLFWDRDRWVLVSQSCSGSNPWTLTYLTPRGDVVGTYVPAMDEDAGVGGTLWARGPDDTLVAVFRTRDTTRALALQEVDVRSREVSPTRPFLTIDDGWDVGLAFTHVTVEPGQGYALGLMMYSPTPLQETWLVRASRTGSLRSTTVLHRGSAIPPSLWVMWLGSGFGAFFHDGDGEAMRRLECVR